MKNTLTNEFSSCWDCNKNATHLIELNTIRMFCKKHYKQTKKKLWKVQYEKIRAL